MGDTAAYCWLLLLIAGCCCLLLAASYQGALAPHQRYHRGFPLAWSNQHSLLLLPLLLRLRPAVFSYAFYVHPMLLPLLQELPRGRPGVDLLTRAVAITTVGR